MHCGPCVGELLAIAGGHRGARGHVWGVCGAGPRPGEGREGAGGARGAARVSVLIGALGRPWRACEGGRRREKEEGDQGLACCGRRGASSGALGRPEVAGGGWQGAATMQERTVARSKACKWPACHFFGKVGMARHVW